ncbi:MAG: hypothetical protein LAO19_15265 [Acidobacteriia bacterium]|nr:hypothetical protein [Terriglobia bacterium]
MKYSIRIATDLADLFLLVICGNQAQEVIQPGRLLRFVVASDLIIGGAPFPSLFRTAGSCSSGH